MLFLEWVRKMSKEMEFFIYLIEHYSFYKNKNTSDVMKELKELNLVEEIFNRYEFYHIEYLKMLMKI